MFNGATCTTPCGTTSPNQYSFPSSDSGYTFTPVATSESWLSIDMSSDGKKL
jgi:hypothetical protein